MSGDLKHLLVIRFSAMGDVAMTVPVLKALTEQHPNLHLTVITKPFFAPLYKDLRNTTVFSPEFNARHKGVFGLYRIYKDLKPLNFDAIADLHSVIKSHVLKLFFYPLKVVQIDKGRAEKRRLVSGKKFQPLKKTVERYVEVFQKLGLAVDLNNTKPYPPSPLAAKISENIGIRKRGYIGIAPFAAHPGKTYPLRLVEQVVAQLSQEYKIILFGGAGLTEIKSLNYLASNYKNVINCAGKYNFATEIKIISNLDLMLSMDSGNGHIAALFGIPVVTLWGITHPYAGFAPFNQPLANAILANRSIFPKIPTSVYGNKAPAGYEDAIASILPETVVTKIKTLLPKD